MLLQKTATERVRDHVIQLFSSQLIGKQFSGKTIVVAIMRKNADLTNSKMIQSHVATALTSLVAAGFIISTQRSTYKVTEQFLKLESEGKLNHFNKIWYSLRENHSQKEIFKMGKFGGLKNSYRFSEPAFKKWCKKYGFDYFNLEENRNKNWNTKIKVKVKVVSKKKPKEQIELKQKVTKQKILSIDSLFTPSEMKRLPFEMRKKYFESLIN